MDTVTSQRGSICTINPLWGGGGADFLGGRFSGGAVFSGGQFSGWPFSGGGGQFS